ncbi:MULTISPECIES: flagellar motor switch protein FliN [Halomonadaceae]|jgi:flagellar motor switch protein FliN/FliY|uniref:flagellar motor switch protein FliN n=1 Tax=Halomonadaceae TaxID=28256 RepID=UPI000A286F71|nr:MULTISPECIES: flagellar motor switch protein FliN [Halomonas]MCW4151241.1 flagellar motor switch protein FliN [Halomonas sp. 18H]MDR5887260.1 flagellar motor switch protein FliN [Halomonas janggokensis]QPL46318.1 flagellar motor switch protein FliN [Halomonas sp. A40-4]
MTDPKKPDQNISDDDWASAMSEQEQEETAASSEAADGEDEDPWAAAMAEQQAVEEEASAEEESAADEAPASEAKAASDDVFRPLTQEGGATPSRDLEMIMDIPVKLTVELGRTKLTIKQLLELAQGSVIELDGLAGEPMDILINGYLVAQGEVVVIEDKYGIRITEIITPSERIHKLNR